MKDLVLIIIYNHNYEKNIEVLDEIYQSRFDHIYHMIPFYTGDNENVIPVYENSYYFEGYVEQANKFLKNKFRHYFFIADDLIVNPRIDQNNFKSLLKLNEKSCFIPSFINLHETKNWWVGVHKAYHWNLNVPGIEAGNFIPNYAEALEKIKKFDLSTGPLRFEQIWNVPKQTKSFIRMMIREKELFFRYVMNIFQKKEYSVSYPLVGGYSDIFIISSDAMNNFSHYCGIFSATHLFAELAIPTSIALSAEEIVTEKMTDFCGKALWGSDIDELNKYQYSLYNLLNMFPEDYLYLHPIKLSKWENDLEARAGENLPDNI